VPCNRKLNKEGEENKEALHHHKKFENDPSIQ
jgi:hypothetical protein